MGYFETLTHRRNQQDFLAAIISHIISKQDMLTSLIETNMCLKKVETEYYNDNLHSL